MSMYEIDNDTRLHMTLYISDIIETLIKNWDEREAEENLMKWAVNKILTRNLNGQAELFCCMKNNQISKSMRF